MRVRSVRYRLHLSLDCSALTHVLPLSLFILVQAAVEAVSKPNKQNENSTPSSSTGDETVGKEQASEQGKGKKKGKTVGASDEADTGPVLHPKPTVRVMYNDLD